MASLGGILPHCNKLIILNFLDSNWSLLVCGYWDLSSAWEMLENKKSMSSEGDKLLVEWNGLMEMMERKLKLNANWIYWI